MKTVLMTLVILWFIFGMSAAHNRGFFNSSAPRTCVFVGTASLTVVAGPLAYFHLWEPEAYC
jgi:hypothetical protein